MLRGIFSSQRHPQWMILMALAFIGAGCASSGRVAEPPPTVHLPHPDDASDPVVAATEHETVDVERLLREEFTRWEGTPHRGAASRPQVPTARGLFYRSISRYSGCPSRARPNPRPAKERPSAETNWSPETSCSSVRPNDPTTPGFT